MLGPCWPDFFDRLETIGAKEMAPRRELRGGPGEQGFEGDEPGGGRKRESVSGEEPSRSRWWEYARMLLAPLFLSAQAMSFLNQTT